MLTNGKRSSDGLTLLVSSSDGFCSTLSFSPSELGQIYTGEIGAQKAALPGATSIPSNQNTPVPTPTAVFAPPSPFPSGSHHRHRDSAGSLAAASPPSASFVSQRASSPARSNSVSSVVTQSSTAQAGVISNPSLIVGQVPSIAATNSGKVIGVPMTTPPETPQGSVSGAGAKRDTSESELDDPSGGQPKRRRIAPTLVSGGGGSSTDSGDHKP